MWRTIIAPALVMAVLAVGCNAGQNTAPTPTRVAVSPANSARKVVANTDGMGVFVRQTRIMADKIKAWPDGTIMRVTGGEVEGEGRKWLQAEDPDGNVGWIPAEYLAEAGGLARSAKEVAKNFPTPTVAARSVATPTASAPRPSTPSQAAMAGTGVPAELRNDQRATAAYNEAYKLLNDQRLSEADKRSRMRVVQNTYGEAALTLALRYVPVYDQKEKRFVSFDTYMRNWAAEMGGNPSSGAPIERDPVGATMRIFFDPSPKTIYDMLGLEGATGSAQAGTYGGPRGPSGSDTQAAAEARQKTLDQIEARKKALDRVEKYVDSGLQKAENAVNNWSSAEAAKERQDRVDKYVDKYVEKVDKYVDKVDKYVDGSLQKAENAVNNWLKKK